MKPHPLLTLCEELPSTKKIHSTRRDFLQNAMMAAFSGIAITIVGCGKDNASADQNETGSISANHGHSAIVSAAQITAGAAIELNITGSSTHSHVVSLSASQINAIGQGTTVNVTSSSGDSHTHLVSFN